MQRTAFDWRVGAYGTRKSWSNYRIYSINRPGRLLNFWILRVGANSGLGAYKIFNIFSKSSMFILQQNNKW